MTVRKLLQQVILTGLVAAPIIAMGAAATSAQNLYGAIARSRSTGDKGYAWNYSSRYEAERRAIAECNSYSGAGDCRALLWFRNACGSIAESNDGGAGTGWGTTRALSQDYALDSCNGIGSGCRVTRTICTGR
jgi:serine/threonine-protein kinase